MEKGSPFPRGATPDADGVNFSVYSGVADSVELCLLDGSAEERIPLPECTSGYWHGYLPRCRPGQRYGYRVHGPYEPGAGLRCNPHKLLIDPCARALAGIFTWDPAVFDFVGDGMSMADSAAFVPKSVVTERAPEARRGPVVPWSDMVIYELNVRGYTMRHPGIADSDRGRFSGLSNGAILDYIKSLGITSVELMPVYEFIDERFLAQRGLRNYWGYNPISWFAPAMRYAQADPRGDFIEMVNAIHDAGLEVILDVVYNHTAESDRLGPTLSFRGLDNQAYYRLEPDDPGTYVDDTGCGNTVNADHPTVRELVLDSLAYWVQAMGVDGFRFDLATVLGRTHDGYAPDHPLLRDISEARALADVKLIAEPWDPGPEGYQLGSFSHRWGEWNDRYRDVIRRFWRGDEHQAGEFARSIHGSADLFEASDRGPSASINLVTAHDGFTLADVVSYERRHNEANGENNEDGHAHNISCNHGIEGPTTNEEILGLRRRQRLNMLATLLLSQGTPMILAGDEFGNSQGGNNNAYAQDNETGWLDWSGADSDPAFVDAVRDLVGLRRECPVFRSSTYRHGRVTGLNGWLDVEWLGPDGTPLDEPAWHATRALAMRLADEAGAVVLLFNASADTVVFRLHQDDRPGPWRLAFYSGSNDIGQEAGWALTGRSAACLVST